VAAQADAERLLADVERKRVEYDESLQKMRATMAQEAAAARNAAQEEGQRALATARAEANAEMGRLRADVAAQIAAARSTVAGAARSIAEEMLARVMQRAPR